MHIPPSRCGLTVLSLAGIGLLAVIVRPTAAQPKPLPAGQPVPPGVDATAVAKSGFENLSFPDEGEARDARLRFEAVQDYLKERRGDAVPWDRVCDTAQFLLDAKSDYFYESKDAADPEGRKRYVSIKDQTNKIIGSFPKEGRQFYQVTFGPPADALLKQAAADGYDKGKLADISQRYFHTQAGGQATLLLATLNLEAGRFAEAAYGFDRLLARPDADDLLTARTLLKAAVAFKRAGDPRHAEAVDAVWAQLEKKFPRDGLVIGRRAYSLDDLKTELGRSAELVFGSLGDDLVAMRYGNPSHTGATAGGTPFLDPAFSPYPMLWRKPDPDDKSGDAQNAREAAGWIKEQIEAGYKLLKKDKGQVALPGFFPVSAPNLILFRTYDGVCAVVSRDGFVHQGQTYRAGELFWASIATQVGVQNLVGGPNQQNFKMWWQQWQQQHGMSTLVFDNPQVGSLSHDGKLVYYVDDLGLPPPPQVYNPNIGGFQPVGGTITAGNLRNVTDYSRLQAVDISTGQLKWQLGGPVTDPVKPEDDERTNGAAKLLQDAIFLGPPLPVNGLLYVMFEKEQQLHLVCLNPHKVVSQPAGGHNPQLFPELVWVQKLGSPNIRLNQDSLRRVQPAYLAYADGVLVCPTNCGAVVAVDVNARSLLWARGYATPPTPDVMNGEFPGRARIRGRAGVPLPPGAQPLSSDRWRAAAPIIAGGKVVVAAHDANQIQCLDLRTGDILWTDNRQADDLYVGGVANGKVIVVGKRTVRGYELAGDGAGHPKPAWPNLRIGTPSGHGTITKEGLFFLPMIGDADRTDGKDPQVWAINVDTGAAKSKTTFRRDDFGVDPQYGPDDVRKRLALGNLLFHDGLMFSQSASQVSAFPLIELKKQEMDRLLANNPKDPTGLADRGELLLDNGKIQEAIRDFKESQANDPSDPVRRRVRQKLYQAYTELLRNDFAAGEPILAEYETLCEVPIDTDDPTEKARLMDEQIRRKGLFLSLVAKGREKQGRLTEAFQYYRAFAALGDNRQLVSIYDEPNSLTRPDVWARGRIDAMIRNAKDPAARKPLEEQVAKDWQAVRAANDLARLREFVKVFGPYFAEGREAQLLLAEQLLLTNNDEYTRDAQIQLMQLWATAEDGVTQARAVDALARVMTRRGLLEDAVGLYVQLGTKYADVVVRDGKTGADIYEELITDKRLLPYLEPVRSSAPGRYRVEPLIGQTGRPVTQMFTVAPDGDQFPFFRRNRVTIEMNPPGSGNSWLLRVTDRVTGEERSRFADLNANQPMMGGGMGAPTYRIAQASGHIMLVNIGQWAYCYDLSVPAADGKLGKELWRYDLFKKNPQPQNMQPQPQPFDPKNPDELVVSYEDGWTLRLGRSAVLQPTYACLITRDGLVALDPTAGADSPPLWQRSDVSPKAQVFGDARYVFLIETTQFNLTRSRVLRAVDGSTVEGVKDFSSVFTSSDRVAVLGRHILLGEGRGAVTRALRLYDPLAGKDVWRKEFPRDTVLIKTLDPELTGAMMSDGTFEVLSARTGQSVFRGGIDKDRAAAHMSDPAGGRVSPLILADGERFYLFLNRQHDAAQRYGGYSMIRSVPVNGVVYGFDRATGKRLWFYEGLFQNQSLLAERFDELPALIAAAQVPDENTKMPVYKVTILDKQLGKLLHNKGYPAQSVFTSMVSPDPKNPRVIELSRHDLRIRIVPDDTGTRPITSASAVP